MLQNILQWHNLIFYVSILLGLVFVFFSVSGVGLETDADIDHDFNLDQDLDHDIHAIHGGLKVELDGNEGFFLKVLSLFGVGKCPLSIVLFTAFLLFGIAGLTLNTFIPPMFRVLSVICALFVAITGTRLLASTISKFMPQTETYNIVPQHFIGRRGRVVIAVSDVFGQIHVTDQYGSLHKLNVRSYGKHFAIEEGVLITEYKDGIYYVDKPKEELL